MTKRAWFRVLTQMQVNERDPELDGQIVAHGIDVWLDDQRIHRSTLNDLLYLMAVTNVSDEGAGLERYALNSVGRALLVHPEEANMIWEAIQAGGAWTIENNRVVRLDDAGAPSTGGPPAEPGTSAARSASE